MNDTHYKIAGIAALLIALFGMFYHVPTHVFGAANGGNVTNFTAVDTSAGYFVNGASVIDGSGNTVAPSVTGTSTFANAVTIGGSSGSTHPYLLISTTTTPYGYFPEDMIDAGGYANDFFAINAFNGGKGACAQSGFIANGDIALASAYYGSMMVTNSGYTGSGCGISPLTGVAPFDVSLFAPSGAIDFTSGSTTPTSGFNWLEGATGSNNVMKLTATGLLGIGTTTPVALLQVTATTTNATSTLEFGKSGQTMGACLKMYNDAGTAEYVTIHGTTLTVSASTCKSGF